MKRTIYITGLSSHWPNSMNHLLHVSLPLSPSPPILSPTRTPFTTHTSAPLVTPPPSLQAMTPPGKTRSDLPAATIIGAGGLGGMAYWLAFYPADTVKSLMQTGAEGCAQRPGRTRSARFRESLRPLSKGRAAGVVSRASAHAAPRDARERRCFLHVRDHLGGAERRVLKFDRYTSADSA